jgi:hypothetical protein
MTVGFFLQSLLKSLSRPFAAFGHDFHLNLTQRPGTRLFSVHPFPLVVFFCWSDEEPFTPSSKPYSRGQCQDAPHDAAGREI